MIPDTHTIQEVQLPVGDGHELYVQLWGKKSAHTTFIYLHGGPGSGCHDGHKAYFDPAKHQVIFFDQRGCGKSMPYGSLQNNTTEDLVRDISKVADHFGIEKFVLVGRSWGSCLALAYALVNPTKVSAMVIGGIFTGSQSEIDFIEQGEFKAFFPEAWEAFLARTPEKFRNNPAKYHQKRMFEGNEKAALESAYAFAELEGSLVRLDDRHAEQDKTTFDPVSTRIEIHYTANRCFMEDEYIFTNASKLNMPVKIIQGRYDAVCKPAAAHRLHSALPNSQLTWTIAGHSSSDRANFDVTKALIETMSNA